MSISRAGLLVFLLGAGLACLATLSVFAAINYCADPLWIWGSENALNRISVPFDIRVQRVNLMLHAARRFNTLIVGSSRTANIALSREANAFNFSVHTMLPQECADVVKTAQDINGSGFDRVLVGLDFETTNGHYRTGLHAPFQTLLQQSRDTWYKLESAVSVSTLSDAMETILASMRGVTSNCTVGANASPCYDHDRHFFMRTLDPPEWERQAAHELQSYEKAAASYWFETSFKDSIAECRDRAGPGVQAFLTPEHARLFQIQMRQVDAKHYRRFVTDAVDVFGTLIAFDQQRPMWARPDTFFDLHHPSLRTAALISQCVEGGIERCDPQLGATRVDRSNLDTFLAHALADTGS